MFNMHPQNLTLEDLINFLTYSYPENVYIRELCERIVDWEEEKQELESEVEYAEERLAQVEGELEDLIRELEEKDD